MADDWRYVPAEQFCASVRDGTHDSPKRVNHGRFLVTSRHITGGQLDLANAYRIAQDDFDAINKRSKVDQWDVLLSMIGTVGEPYLIKDTPDFAIKNIGLFKTKGETEGKWLFYYLRSPAAQQLIREQSRGTTQQYIPLGALRQFPVIVPDNREEMRAITGILSTLDDKIELNRRINETLEALAQSLFKSWFMFPTQTRRPNGWRRGTLGDLVELRVDRIEPTPEKDELRYVALEDMPSKSLDLSMYQLGSAVNSSIVAFQKGDILFGSMRPYFHKVGLAFFDGITRTTTFVLRPKDECFRHFCLFHFFSSEVVDFATTTSVGTTIPYVKWDALQRYEIALPPQSILEDFEKIVAPLVQRIANNGEESRTLSALRDGLLPKLLSGEVRLRARKDS